MPLKRLQPDLKRLRLTMPSKFHYWGLFAPAVRAPERFPLVVNQFGDFILISCWLLLHFLNLCYLCLFYAKGWCHGTLGRSGRKKRVLEVPQCLSLKDAMALLVAPSKFH